MNEREETDNGGSGRDEEEPARVRVDGDDKSTEYG